jgi:hypothetical protein
MSANDPSIDQVAIAYHFRGIRAEIVDSFLLGLLAGLIRQAMPLVQQKRFMWGYTQLLLLVVRAMHDGQNFPKIMRVLTGRSRLTSRTEGRTFWMPVKRQLSSQI